MYLFLLFAGQKPRPAAVFPGAHSTNFLLIPAKIPDAILYECFIAGAPRQLFNHNRASGRTKWE
ncbi:MAG: hypothetical protein CVV32_09845 [Methanomicrobiales archaeon HGW-Methanomicrobiales-3]|nr:MAG: hypothetical protein CVV32_09845 [Methanomicrobiales archaeon HGW-Methanomicrobiales-3]